LYVSTQLVAKAFTRLGDIANKQKKYEDAINFYSKSLLEETNYSVKKKLKAVSSFFL
jgi:hypothetical protein